MTMANRFIAVQRMLHHFAQRHWGLLAAVVLMSVLNYGVLLFDLTLFIDDEFVLYNSPPGQPLIARGRWGLYALRHLLLPEVVMPIVPATIAIGGLSLAAILFNIAWRTPTQTQAFAISSLLVSFPILTTMFVFKSVGTGVGVGVLLCALATLSVDKLKPSYLGLAVAAVLTAFALSFYQAMIVVVLGALLMRTALRLVRSDEAPSVIQGVAELAAYLLVAAFGYGLHALITRGLTLALNLPEDPYVASILGPSAFVETLPARFEQGFHLSTQLLLGAASVFGISTPLWSALWGVALALLIGAAFVLHRAGILLALVITALALGANIAAAAIVGAMPRMMLGFVVLSGGIGALMLRAAEYRPILKALSYVLIGLTVFQFVQANNRLLGSALLAYQNDRILAHQIGQEIVRAEARAGVKASYIEVSGYWQPPTTRAIVRVETIGASFFEWDGGDVNRIRMFLSTTGAPLLKVSPPARRIEAIHASLAMPTWPMDGSVTLVGDIAVVKFGPLSLPQLRAIGHMCSRLPEEAWQDERTKTVCALSDTATK